MNRPQPVSADPDEILDHAVNGRAVLQLGRRRGAAHLALALSSRLMRDVGAVVRVTRSVQWSTDGITARRAAGWLRSLSVINRRHAHH